MNVRAALVPPVVVVLLAGCAAGQEQQAQRPTPVAASAVPSPTQDAAATATATATRAPTPSPTSEVRTVVASYAGGEVSGTSGREQVRVGEQVVLRISSDVAEEVHVHGYDVDAAVPAGGSVDIPLTAGIPGVFEVELHESGKVLFQLRVA